MPRFRAPPPQPQNKTRFALSLAPPPNLAGAGPFFLDDDQWVARLASAVSILPFPFFFFFFPRGIPSREIYGESAVYPKFQNRNSRSHRPKSRISQKMKMKKMFCIESESTSLRRAVQQASRASSESERVSSGTVEIDRGA